MTDIYNEMLKIFDRSPFIQTAAAEIQMDSKLVADLGLSSLALGVLASDLEEAFDISISYSMMPSLITVRDVHDCVKKLLGER